MPNYEQELPEKNHPAYELMPTDVRAKLPKLYETEKQGLEAVAPVKYFLPDAQWTWYATEFDGDDILFGLVNGFELELGYFTLSELKAIGQARPLAVERDLYYKPQSLREIQAFHRKLRGEE